MPTALIDGPYRFLFFSRENNEPPHIHVQRDECYAKFWLEPVWLARNKGFRAHELTELYTIVQQNRDLFLRRGMSTLAIKVEPLATKVSFANDSLRVVLADGREVSAPLTWFPRLLNATESQRANWRLIGGGIGIHWPEVDEDISVESLLAKE